MLLLSLKLPKWLPVSLRVRTLSYLYLGLKGYNLAPANLSYFSSSQSLIPLFSLCLSHTNPLSVLWISKLIPVSELLHRQSPLLGLLFLLIFTWFLQPLKSLNSMSSEKTSLTIHFIITWLLSHIHTFSYCFKFFLTWTTRFSIGICILLYVFPELEWNKENRNHCDPSTENRAWHIIDAQNVSWISEWMNPQ